jgi:hypothetical protein
LVERRAEKSRYITEGTTAIADAFGFPRFFLSIVLVLTLQYFDAEIYRESREKCIFFHELSFLISAANFGNLVLFRRFFALFSSHKIE